MTDEIENLILEQLRAIRGILDQHSERLAMLVQRVGAIERDFAGLRTDFATMSLRVDHLEARLIRIENRLDLVDG